MPFPVANLTLLLDVKNQISDILFKKNSLKKSSHLNTANMIRKLSKNKIRLSKKVGKKTQSAKFYGYFSNKKRRFIKNLVESFFLLKKKKTGVNLNVYLIKI